MSSHNIRNKRNVPVLELETKMYIIKLILLVIPATQCQERGATTSMFDMPTNLAIYDDAHHRGHKWYDFSSSFTSTSTDDSEPSSEITDSSTETYSSERSSKETKERKRMTAAYRHCTPCPEEMMKNFRNRGIKWICGNYQRARRTFKSECMMRYRNCQDGTMFVKVHDHKCNDDLYHGRHWFYIYRV